MVVSTSSVSDRFHCFTSTDNFRRPSHRRRTSMATLPRRSSRSLPQCGRLLERCTRMLYAALCPMRRSACIWHLPLWGSGRAACNGPLLVHHVDHHPPSAIHCASDQNLCWDSNASGLLMIRTSPSLVSSPICSPLVCPLCFPFDCLQICPLCPMLYAPSLLL